LDYAEPGQRALLVEGIRPVLPLIRNTPYGKRIQNKLQREQMDHFGGGSFNNQQALVNMALSNQGMGLHHGPAGAGARHIPQAIHQNQIHQNQMVEVYAAQSGLYPAGGPGLQNQGSFNQGHIPPQLHNMQPQPIDGYVLQGNSSHNQGISPSHSHGNGFSGVPGFNNVGPFGGVGLSAGTLNDHYQRASFGYGM
jgi:hypothetical protein